MHTSDITFDMRKNSMHVHNKRTEPWKITLVDTGETSMTGGRLLRVKSFLSNEETFFFTYGDGLSDIDVTATLLYHKKHRKIATLTAVSLLGVLVL